MSASGVYVHAHFCGGELSSVSFFALDDADACGCGDESMASDCCKDVLHFYKVDTHQNGLFVKASEIISIKLISLQTSIGLVFTNYFSSKLTLFSAHAPPPYLFAKASKLIVNSVFRI